MAHKFYKEDCKRVGVNPGDSLEIEQLPVPLSMWERLPTITKLADKIAEEDQPRDSFYADTDLQNMDIRLGNMAYYYGHQQKLLDDIGQESIESTYHIPPSTYKHKNLLKPFKLNKLNLFSSLILL